MKFSAQMLVALGGTVGTEAAVLQQKQSGSIAPVIKLVKDMISEVQQDSKTARDEFDKVEDQCSKVHTQEKHNIEMLGQQLTQQRALAEEAKAKVVKASDKLQAANEKLTKTNEKLEKAEKIFKEETEEFNALDEGSAKTVSMVGRAIRALQQSANDAKEKAEKEAAEDAAASGDEVVLLQENRKKDHARFLAKQQKSLDAVTQAMDALVRADLSTLEHKDSVLSLLSMSSSDTESLTMQAADTSLNMQPTTQAGETKAYESKMGGTIDMFEKFMAEEEATRNARQQEWSAKKEKKMLVIQELRNEIDTYDATIVREKEKKATAGENQGKAESKITTLTGELNESKTTLNDNTIECKTAKEDHDRLQADFTEQLTALQKAQQILEQAPDLLQTNANVYAFVQLNAETNSQTQTESMEIQTRKTKASIYLEKLARTMQGSVATAFQQISVRVAESPFGKVQEMIKTMIGRLEKEAAEAETKKAYCDKASKKAKEDIEKKTREHGKINARLQQATADKDTLVKKNGKLQKRLEEIMEDTKSMTEIRSEEKKTNDEEIERSASNAEAVSRAITVLQEYFSEGAPEGEEAAPTEEFMQTSFTSFTQMKTQTKTRMQTRTKDANAIIFLLQEAEADFSRQNADTKSIEAELAADYKKAMEDFKLETAVTKQSMQGNEAEISRLKKMMADADEDLEAAEKELEDANVFKQKIQEECEVKVDSYEQRKERREKEISGLKTALEILSGEAASAA